MALYHKYRPGTLDDVIGNEQTVETLKADLTKKGKPHAYLFHGPTGCGKTTLGRIVAQELGCVGSDFREVDSADFRGIDTVREIRKQAHFRSLEGDTRVWLIDEVHKMTGDAQNALLKILEDTPSHVYFILATTEPQKLLPTIRGRCAQYPVAPLNDLEMKHLLKRIVKAEEERLTRDVYDQIIQDSLGHPRNAIQILDQVLGVPEEKRITVAQQVAERNSQVIELCRALVRPTSWGKVSTILSGLRTEDPESIRRAILGYCNTILLKESNATAGFVMEQMIEPFYNTGFPGLTLACYTVVFGNDDVPF